MADLRKLKLGKSGVTIASVERRGKAGEILIQHEATCPHAPHPDLVCAMANLLQPCLALLQLPQGYRQNLTVSSVVLSEQKAGKRGLVVNLVKKLSDSKRPLNLSTPLLVEEESDDHEDFGDAVDQIGREAEAYMGGKRAQMELPLKDGPAGERAAAENEFEVEEVEA